MCHSSERVQNLRQLCASNEPPKQKRFSQFIIVDDRHKVIACLVPKVGCTSFREMMLMQTGLVPVNATLGTVHNDGLLRRYGLNRLRDYSPTEVQPLLQEYTKLIVVRHPLDRLISAYNDKFVTHWKIPLQLNKTFTRTFGANAVELINGVPRITFRQFLMLIRHLQGDHHWEPYVGICQPCRVQYDSVLKLETLESDLEQALPLFLNPGQQTVKFPHWNWQRYQTNKLNSVTKTFHEVDPQLVNGTLDIYQHDMALFGYTWDNVTGAGCHYGNHSMCC